MGRGIDDYILVMFQIPGDFDIDHKATYFATLDYYCPDFWKL